MTLVQVYAVLPNPILKMKYWSKMCQIKWQKKNHSTNYDDKWDGHWMYDCHLYTAERAPLLLSHL